MEVFQPKEKEWFTLGKVLKVDTKYRQQLMEQDELSNKRKMEAILNIWIESRSRFSWYWGELRSIVQEKLKWRDVVHVRSKCFSKLFFKNGSGGVTGIMCMKYVKSSYFVIRVFIETQPTAQKTLGPSKGTNGTSVEPNGKIPIHMYTMNYHLLVVIWLKI